MLKLNYELDFDLPIRSLYVYSITSQLVKELKKVMERMKRRNCDSFVKTFLPYLVTLFCTLVELHCRVVDFLVKPVDELQAPPSASSPPVSPALSTKSFDFPSISPPSSPKLVRQHSSSSTSSRHKKFQKREFWKNRKNSSPTSQNARTLRNALGKASLSIP